MCTRTTNTEFVLTSPSSSSLCAFFLLYFALAGAVDCCSASSATCYCCCCAITMVVWRMIDSPTRRREPIDLPRGRSSGLPTFGPWQRHGVFEAFAAGHVVVGGQAASKGDLWRILTSRRRSPRQLGCGAARRLRRKGHRWLEWLGRRLRYDRGFFCHDVDGVAAGHRVVARPAILSADEGSRRRQVNLWPRCLKRTRTVETIVLEHALFRTLTTLPFFAGSRTKVTKASYLSHYFSIGLASEKLTLN